MLSEIPPEQDRVTVEDLKIQITKLLEGVDAVEAVQEGNHKILASIISKAQTREREHRQLSKAVREMVVHTGSEEARNYAQSLEAISTIREEEINSLKYTLEMTNREYQHLISVYQEAKDYVKVLEAALKGREEELALVKSTLENSNREYNQLVNVNQEAKDYVRRLETTLETREAELISAKRELLAISSSRAWRLTQKLKRFYRPIQHFSRPPSR